MGTCLFPSLKNYMSSDDEDFRVDPSSELDNYLSEDEKKQSEEEENDHSKKGGNLQVTNDLTSTFKILMYQ